MVEAEASEYSGVLKTRKLLIFRDAKNAANGKIAPNWIVSGTRDFQPAGQSCKGRSHFSLAGEAEAFFAFSFDHER